MMPAHWLKPNTSKSGEHWSTTAAQSPTRVRSSSQSWAIRSEERSSSLIWVAGSSVVVRSAHRWVYPLPLQSSQRGHALGYRANKISIQKVRLYTQHQQCVSSQGAYRASTA